MEVASDKLVHHEVRSLYLDNMHGDLCTRVPALGHEYVVQMCMGNFARKGQLESSIVITFSLFIFFRA